MADALSKPYTWLWRTRSRAPMPGAELGPLNEIAEGCAREYVFGCGTTVFSMFVVRQGGDRVYGYLNLCPHYSMPLNYRAGQFMNGEGTRMRCTMHFAEFRFEDGFGVSGAAERCGQDPMPVAVKDGVVHIAAPQEYDAGRPDAMFLIQRVLEAEGRLTILDHYWVFHPHPSIRLFATAIGLGDMTGLYHGTQQFDPWNVTVRLDYLDEAEEIAMIAGKARWSAGEETLGQMVRMGGSRGPAAASTVMSPRSVLSSAENARQFGNIDLGSRTAFLNRCHETERGSSRDTTSAASAMIWRWRRQAPGIGDGGHGTTGAVGMGRPVRTRFSAAPIAPVRARAGTARPGLRHRPARPRRRR